MGPYIKRYLEFCDQHDRDGWTESDLYFFKTNIEFLQHERLIHLIVLIATIFVFLIVGILCFITDSTILSILGLVMTMLVFCYLHYYVYLENKTQYFYKRYENAWNSINKISCE